MTGETLQQQLLEPTIEVADAIDRKNIFSVWKHFDTIGPKSGSARILDRGVRKIVNTFRRSSPLIVLRLANETELEPPVTITDYKPALIEAGLPLPDDIRKPFGNHTLTVTPNPDSDLVVAVYSTADKAPNPADIGSRTPHELVTDIINTSGELFRIERRYNTHFDPANPDSEMFNYDMGIYDLSFYPEQVVQAMVGSVRLMRDELDRVGRNKSYLEEFYL